ncbi:MarR family transcriptional regulator [Rhodococcus sp. G-MC3]|uniref:MarR family winged helix-turn-helix transcriptional regulator n=1 Tax=Rhodococcus sp. G-MC3 TaxID=3046209 RepID=UPI0024B976E4|nr:MarR family transcriptional regulator [Rhodococcus sp. G-MC3]MDJ0396574.1 MarR family transcriptional regulator [Rhodococcus sp. G-MC3]
MKLPKGAVTPTRPSRALPDRDVDAAVPGQMEPATYVVDAISRLHRAVHQVANLRLRQWNMTLSSYVALRIIADQPSLSLAQLARRGFVRPQTMTRIVSQLEKRGFVERHHRPENERALSLHVTASGEVALTEMGAEVNKINATVGGVLEPAEILELDAMVRRVASAVEADIKDYPSVDIDI